MKVAETSQLYYQIMKLIIAVKWFIIQAQVVNPINILK